MPFRYISVCCVVFFLLLLVVLIWSNFWSLLAMQRLSDIMDMEEDDNNEEVALERAVHMFVMLDLSEVRAY